jgi:GNAT superfamily N-acetyltransferase
MNQAVEEQSLNAWSAFETINYNGWLLRFADGYTKRANSVTVLDNVKSDLEDKIAYCKSQYRSRQQKPIFCLLSFTNPTVLDLALANRGYQLVDPTLVMGLTLSASERSPNTKIAIDREKLNDWLANYYDLNALEKQQSHIHYRILAAIDSDTLFASLKQNGEILACGIGVLESGYLGIFDVFTNQIYRQRGYATALVQGLLQWGIDKGASFSYLQVVKANIPACKLYKKLGYQPMYEYWYRVGSV